MRRLHILLAAALIVPGTGARAQNPPATTAAPASLGLIPEPREGRLLGDAPLRGGIAVLPGGNAEDRFAAEDLTAALRERGIRVGGSGALQVRLLRAETPAGREALRRAGYAFTPEMKDEGYVLLARATQVDIVGATGAGVFYGAQTLKQLVHAKGAQAWLNEATIRDWPAMRWRGWQDDMSRGPVPTMDFIKKQIRTLAAYKVNALSPYWEHTLAYPDQPLIAPPGGAITPAEAKELVAYAKPYHITIIPEQEAFGHLHHVLKYEAYSSLGETPNGHVLAPGDAGSLPLIRSMFAHIDSIFPGPYVHIGADETFELGRGRTAADVKGRGLSAVYMDFLKQVAGALEPSGKRLLFWGDIAVSAPDLVKTLPKNLVAVPWGYDSADSFVRDIKPFTDAGMETWVAPGTNGWNKVWPDMGVALINIRNFTRDGQALGAVGQLNTSWDDDGETLFNSIWYSLLFGAAAAWQPGESSIPDFQKNFGRIFHGDASGKIDLAQQKLIEAHALLRSRGLSYGSDWLFWTDPWNGEGVDAARRMRGIAPQLRLLAEDALKLTLEARAAGLREGDALDALQLGARKLDFIGMKFQLADQVTGMYAEAARLATDTTPGHPSPGWNISDMSSMNGRLQDLRDGYSLIRDLYEQAWLRENRPYWLHNVLARYDVATRLWIERMDRVSDVRRTFGRTRRFPAAWEVGLPQPDTTVIIPAPRPVARQ
ncbi:MAG TPA: glycoside hydrolase family 20 zincin-like fold domain-containing protein [Longimicrobiales bacterium]